tara:strand:+ start:2338 stop:3522 length:1185 start_codon:yes stop_codon:yes gene_type:complete
MHLLETYALNCGAKIDKPYIYEQYYPLGEDRYITIQPYSRNAGKQYIYWAEVVNYILPYLEKENIKIVQLGDDEDKPIPRSIWTQGSTSLNQCAYLLSHTMLHVGVDSFAAHIASGYGKKIVALYSTTYVENSKPYWSKSEDFVGLEPDRTNRKPSFQLVDKGKQSINEIKPEVIAKSILDILGIKNKIEFETLRLGEQYTKTYIHVVPSNVAILDNQISFIVCRMDLEFNEPVLFNQLSRSQKISIITDKPINTNLLLQRMGNIQDIIYILKDDNDIEFVDFLHKQKVNYVLVSSLKDKKLRDLKLKYLDYNFIFPKESNQDKRKEILEAEGDNLYYKSNIRILKDGKYYPSVAALKKNMPLEGLFDADIYEIIDSKYFWEDLEDFYLLKRVD